MTETNRPRHALDDDTDNENIGLPLRGLAMILIAVAVLLIGWGVFSLTSKDSDESPQAAQTQQGQQAGQDKQGQQTSAPEGDGAPHPGADDSTQPQPEGEGENREEDREGTRENANADNQRDGAAAGAQGGVSKEETYVAVLNNSPIAGLAGDVANKMRDQQWNKTGVGNLPDESGVFPNSVVLYPKGNDAERKLAEQLARDLGIEARERDEATDRTLEGVEMLEGERPAGVVVVTTNDMPR
ncbi:LytR C-terminal domain-containing protein [uncultured Corynebacterium sp.]|uniref:LytR C-terminal domain-containing protein n=1 Tax=uncultured Corynebacterium sp. TaxID=159447 RepID=UPI0025D5F0B2|nr:LytR C-terminal domain-containing protein [uncultured Corynebacterium sp.]